LWESVFIQGTFLALCKCFQPFSAKAFCMRKNCYLTQWSHSWVCKQCVWILPFEGLFPSHGKPLMLLVDDSLLSHSSSTSAVLCLSRSMLLKKSDDYNQGKFTSSLYTINEKLHLLFNSVSRKRFSSIFLW